MKTLSYVQAVKLAVKEMEKYQKLGMEDSAWFWVNRWTRYMVNSPKLTLHREI